MRVKKKLKLWEKIFVIFSIVGIFTIIGIYAYRLMYFYKKTNYTPENAKFVDVITNQMNVVYNGDGLYKSNDNDYYYFGTNVNNYLYYEGMLWRIIGVSKEGIKIITDSNISSLVWGNDTNYENSKIYKWLNTDKFLNSIHNIEELVNVDWCNDTIDINDYKCDKVVQGKVGLVSTYDYLLAGGVNSYLNNQTYYWTVNTSSNKAYYVHSQGGINNEVSSGDLFYSYGVRPVIVLNKDMFYLKGNGTLDNPYIIQENQEIMINEHPVGTYLKYNGYTWRIMEINDNYTKIILDGYLLDDKGEKLKIEYNKIYSYLNNEFINNLNKDELVKFDIVVNEYNYDSGYDYIKVKEKNNNYVGIPMIGDLFITDYSGNWLNTYANNNQKLIYTMGKEGSLFADLQSSENYLRPVISIKNGLIIASGDGTSDNPFVVGDKK